MAMAPASRIRCVNLESSAVAALAVAIALVVAPRASQAQCSSCSAPSLPSGGGSSSDPSARRDDWRGWASVHYGYTSADRTYNGTEETQNSLSQKLALQMGILTGGFEAPTGTGLGITLPFASLWRTNGDIQARDPAHPGETDNGLGDLEVRLRQDVLAPLRLDQRFHLAATAGFVAPTGRYISDPIYITSIGRGVWWGVGELDSSFDITPQWAVLLSGALRVPNGSTPIDFISWGKEADGSAGVRFSQKFNNAWLPRRIVLSLSGQYLWRDGATRKLNGDVLPVDDIGGTFLNLSPSVTAHFTDILFMTVSARVPLWRDVHASLLLSQLVPNAGIYVSFGGTFGGHTAPASLANPAKAPRIGERPALSEVAGQLADKQWTIVAYEATWCEACERLGRELKEWEAGHRTEGVVRKMDASKWDHDVWAKYLPDATELPVVDIFAPDGTLRAHLLGADAFRFRDHIPAAQPLLGSADR